MNPYMLIMHEEFEKAKETIRMDPALIGYLDHGNSLLFAAIDRYNLDMAKFLIEHGIDVNLPASNGQSPLSLASNEKSNPAMIALLKRHGAVA